MTRITLRPASRRAARAGLTIARVRHCKPGAVHKPPGGLILTFHIQQLLMILCYLTSTMLVASTYAVMIQCKMIVSPHKVV